MNDKDRELLQQILQAGGSAAEKGFQQLVHYHFIDGLTTVLVCIALLILSAALFAGLLRWDTEDEDTGGAAIAKGVGMVVVTVLAVIMLCCLQGGFRDMLAPEGAAISALVTKS
jgi:ABC-type Fe3+-siderophore transport system permease subunit